MMDHRVSAQKFSRTKHKRSRRLRWRSVRKVRRNNSFRKVKKKENNRAIQEQMIATSAPFTPAPQARTVDLKWTPKPEKTEEAAGNDHSSSEEEVPFEQFQLLDISEDAKGVEDDHLDEAPAEDSDEYIENLAEVAVTRVVGFLFPGSSADSDNAMDGDDSDDDDWDPLDDVEDESQGVKTLLRDHVTSETRLDSLLKAAKSDREKYTVSLQEAFLNNVWRLITERLAPLWMRQVKYDDSRVPSVRASALEALFERLPMSRVGIAKAMAETTYEYLERFLAELERIHGPPRRRGSFDENGWNTGANEEKCEVDPAMLSISPGTARAVALADADKGDGGILADLVQSFVKVAATACRMLNSQSAPGFVKATTQTVELLSMVLVNLCRARPVLDQHFELLSTCLCRLIPPRPYVAVRLLKRFLSSWPTVDSAREVRWLQLVQTVLLSCPAPAIIASEVHRPLFNQIKKSLGSLHAAVARQTLELVSNMYIMLHYILPFPDALAAVNDTLKENRSHWNSEVCALSEKHFDTMLDYI